jgi:hypothetical protein
MFSLHAISLLSFACVYFSSVMDSRPDHLKACCVASFQYVPDGAANTHPTLLCLSVRVSDVLLQSPIDLGPVYLQFEQDFANVLTDALMG